MHILLSFVTNIFDTTTGIGGSFRTPKGRDGQRQVADGGRTDSHGSQNSYLLYPRQ